MEGSRREIRDGSQPCLIAQWNLFSRRASQIPIYLFYGYLSITWTCDDTVETFQCVIRPLLRTGHVLDNFKYAMPNITSNIYMTISSVAQVSKLWRKMRNLYSRPPWAFTASASPMNGSGRGRMVISRPLDAYNDLISPWARQLATKSPAFMTRKTKQVK